MVLGSREGRMNKGKSMCKDQGALGREMTGDTPVLPSQALPKPHSSFTRKVLLIPLLYR